MEPYDSELRRYYAARAAEYDDDRLYPPDRGPDLRYLRAFVPDFFAGKRVLDVACGTGAWTERIAQAAQSVTGIDINPEVLAIARRRPGLEHAQLAIADAYGLGAELGVFDAAFVGFWFSHVARPRVAQFLTSLHKRLLPGASVLVIDNTDALWRTIPISDHDDQGNTFQMRRLVNGTAFRVLKNFPTEAELLAATTGFGVAPMVRKLEHFWILEYKNRVSTQDVGA